MDETQKMKEKIGDFPYDYLGYWKGTLDIYSVDSLIQSVNMSVLIDDTIDESVFRWELTYNPGENEDKRPYLLTLHNPNNGHYKIDEDNGIILDCFLFGNKLITTFDVESTILTTVNTFNEDELIFEVIAGPKELINTTGDIKIDNQVIPPVNSYQVKTYQRAVLERIRG